MECKFKRHHFACWHMITKASPRRYHLANIQLSFIFDFSSRKATLSALEALPCGLSSLYEQILHRADREHPGLGVLIHRSLIWISASRVPLRCENLCVAITIEDGDTEIDT